MSQNAGALTPSRGNRRFIFLAIVLGLLGAGLVYLATSRDSSTSSSGSTVLVPVVVAKVEIPARTVITPSMVEVKRVPDSAASLTSLTSIADAQGRVTRFPLAVGEQVLSAKLVDLSADSTGLSRSLSFVIPEGKRAFAINATQVQNAGGLVLPGDYVDIVVLHDVEFEKIPGDPESREVVESFLVQTLMQNVEVLAVSQTIVDVVHTAGTDATGETATEGDAVDGETGQRVRNSEARPVPDAITVTLAVTPEEAERLYIAEANGRVRLSVRPFGDDETLPIDYQTKIELLPQDLTNPFEVLR